MNLSQIFTNYYLVIAEFLFEFYVFFILLSVKLQKSQAFLRKFIITTVLVFVVSFGAAAFYTLFGDTVWGRTLVYFLLFLLVFFQGVYCFDESLRTILFLTSAAYAIQNLVYKLYLFQYLFGKLLNVYSFGGGNYGKILFRVMYYLVFLALTLVMYFTFIRKTRTKLAVEKLNSTSFIISLVILVVSVVICSIEDLYFEEIGLSVNLENMQFSELFILRQTGNALSVLFGVTVLYLMYKTLEQRESIREIEQLRHLIGQSEQQYKISKDTINMINVKCHDIKYKLDAAMSGSGVSSEAFSDLKESIAIYDCAIETGNKLLNVLFTEKSLYCESHNIKLSCMIDGKLLSFMRDGDLYCLFGNLADNALEAVTKLEEVDKRVISITVKAKDDMVVVQAENYFSGSITVENGLPVTTKNDRDYHGFGMSSMRMIVRSYGGDMVVTTDGDIFRLTLLFPEK